MICENCNKEHDGSYGSGRFCSCKCARAFSSKIKRKEINEKVSKTLKGRKLNFCNRWKNHIKSNKIRFIEGHCEYCNKIINIAYKKKNRRHYCNGKCRNLHLNKLKICGGLFNQGKCTSKWEFILQECLNKYNIKFEANNRTILKDGKELDIWLPDYKIGIELNGIWHYSLKPYNHNIHKFFNRIVKDILKDIEMKELGYKLYVIEDKDINSRRQEDFKVFFNNFIEKYILNKV